MTLSGTKRLWKSAFIMARFTNIFRLLLIVATLVTASSCVRRPALAEASLLAEFDGEWVGEWSWKKGNWATLQIGNGKVKFANFPYDDDKGGEVVMSGGGVAEFASEWSRQSPCILVTLPGNPKTAVPVYISRDKENCTTISQSFLTRRCGSRGNRACTGERSDET